MKLWELVNPEIEVINYLNESISTTNNYTISLAMTSLKFNIPTNKIVKMVESVNNGIDPYNDLIDKK